MYYWQDEYLTIKVHLNAIKPQEKSLKKEDQKAIKKDFGLEHQFEDL